MSVQSRQQRLKTIISGALLPIVPEPPKQRPRLLRLSGIRWVVFDVYGTLLTSSETTGPRMTDCGVSVQQAFQESAERCRCGTGPAVGQALAERFRALIVDEHRTRRTVDLPQPEVDVRSVWKQAFLDLGCPSITDDDIEEEALRFELAVNRVWPMPHAKQVILQLHTNGFQLGIISNAQFYTPLILETLFEDTLGNLGFSETIWSYTDRAAKPSLSIFERFLTAARVREPVLTAGNVLYIGNDIRNDVEPAGKMGFRTALFAGDRRSLHLGGKDPDLEPVKPDVVLTDLIQLTNVLPDTPVEPAAPTDRRKGRYL